MRTRSGFCAPTKHNRLILLTIACTGLGLQGASLLAVGVASAQSETSPWRPVKSNKPNVRRVEVDTQGGSNILVHVIRQQEAVTIENVREALSDRTRITVDPVHGMQIAYSAPNGKIYLWYPGNAAILRGRWKAEPFHVEFVEKNRVLRRVEESKACFDYGSNTFNPATGHAGAGWECAPSGTLRQNVYRNVPGDLFNLGARIEVPFVLRRNDLLTIENIQSRIGN